MRRMRLTVGAFLLAASLPRAAAAQEPATFYEENCATCHTIGGGVAGGPDLRGVTARRDREWLLRFLLDPDAFAKDPVVIQMIKEADGLAMGPTEGLTRQLAEALLVFIEKTSGDIPAAAVAEAFAPFTPEEIARGRALFNGTSRLSARGPACIACHIGGDLRPFTAGRLAPDLGDVHQRLGGARGVAAWLGATQSPMMRSLYRDARLTGDEARALAAFLETQPQMPMRGWAVPPHLLGGLIAAVLTLVLAGAVWRRRLRDIRRPLVRGARHRTRSVPGRTTLGGFR
jgi:mono/diheme cytochrome c family protein